MLKSWKSQKINKPLKNGEKNIFWGRFWAPKTPFLGILGGFGGPEPPPQNIFFAIFQGFVNFLGLPAFQRAFTFYLMLKFGRIMMFLRKFGFLVKNLDISYGKICPKCDFGKQKMILSKSWRKQFVLKFSFTKEKCLPDF